MGEGLGKKGCGVQSAIERELRSASQNIRSYYGGGATQGGEWKEGYRSGGKKLQAESSQVWGGSTQCKETRSWKSRQEKVGE